MTSKHAKLVLIGAGHAHALVLDAWRKERRVGMKPLHSMRGRLRVYICTLNTMKNGLQHRNRACLRQFWCEQFEKLWPAGTQAHTSYMNRIKLGPNYQATQVVRRF